ncbi:MAG TPA: NlpC/P60 family protein [Candidatus Limnocylindrales bacterium]|nr:NlpC/P60 family protein [Candidatus Limnocylindrales bacterium]
MPDFRRAPRLLVFTLALPVIALVYISTFGSRLWAALRPAAATFLGATVIGSVYAEEAYRRAPATPMRAAAVLALAVALVGPGVASPSPTYAGEPAEAVIAAAREYLGANYVLGAEGPRVFDCSGLIYRVFADTGDLPRVGGMRLRAAGYMRWFMARGLYSRDASDAERGDLVVWNNGEHIGFYLGDGKALSALVQPWGVTIHGLHSINMRVTQFLHVNWGGGDSGNNGPDNPGPGPNPDNPQPGFGDGRPGDNNGDQTNAGNPAPNPDGNGDPDGNGNGDPDGNGNGNPDGNGPSAGNDNENPVRPGNDAVATGTMNLRQAADPNSRIIGWVGRGGRFRIIDRGNSPAGYLWYRIRTNSGKEGWLYSRWVQEL